MPTNLPDQNWTVPAGPDLADNPLAFTDFAADVLDTVVLRYPNIATRDAFNGTRAIGDISFTTGNTWYDRWTGTKWLPCTPIQAFQSADINVNNSTVLVSVPTLSVPLPTGNSHYALDAFIRYASNTTADYKCTLIGPAGSTIVFSGPALDTAAGSATGSAFFGETIAPATLGVGGTGATGILPLRASIGLGATTGSLTFQFAQNTANVSNTSTQTFSWMRVTAID